MKSFGKLFEWLCFAVVALGIGVFLAAVNKDGFWTTVKDAPIFRQVNDYLSSASFICGDKDAEFRSAHAKNGKKTGGTLLHYAAKANACTSAAQMIFDSTPERRAIIIAKKLSEPFDNWQSDATDLPDVVDVNAFDNEGLTPLHWAVRALAVETVKLLISRGAHVNGGAKESGTPLDEVMSWKRSSLAAKQNLVVAMTIADNRAEVAEYAESVIPKLEKGDKALHEIEAILRDKGGRCRLCR